MEYFWQHIEREGLKQQFAAHRSKFLLVHSSSGFKHALKEVMSDSAVSLRLSDTKVCVNASCIVRQYKKHSQYFNGRPKLR